MKLYLFFPLFFIVLAGCNSIHSYTPNRQPLESVSLPVPDTRVSINNLSACTDSDEKSISIDSQSPITILVHGCNGSAGRFRSLAQLYAFHGQQAVCYSYDDRDSLVMSAEQLAISINDLASVTGNQKISIVGHSMGGLIARKALEDNKINSNPLEDNNLELVTISAPFSGIEAANQCGIKPLHWISFGIVPSICWLITGDNWNEITASSKFINQPQPLIPSVQSYLKIVTNEKNTCRKKNENGDCITSDEVFSLSEQYQSTIDNYSNLIGVQVDAGHVEIVGNKDIIPRKLLAILQENGMIEDTPSNRKAALERLFAKLY